jgi:DNA-3-methyladenine glycosylase
VAERRETSLAQALSAPATVVAPKLLGAILRVGEVALRITEVEAYLGDGTDPGSHAFRGRTPRNLVMFDEPGYLYVYFTYGQHYCANVVCSPPGEASAVLLRAGQIVDGIELARERRVTTRGDSDLASGPARLTVALGITLADNGADLAGPRIRLELPTATAEYSTSPRTGVSGQGGTAQFPWRFWIPDDPTVSQYRAHRPR